MNKKEMDEALKKLKILFDKDDYEFEYYINNRFYFKNKINGNYISIKNES